MNALSKVTIGRVQTVAKLRTKEVIVRRKLMALGITPGSNLTGRTTLPLLYCQSRLYSCCFRSGTCC